MKKFILSIIAAIFPIVSVSAQDVIGKWKLDDGSAVVEIYKDGESFNGKIIWLQEPLDKNGSPAKDLNNPDPSLRSREIIGLNMLNGLKKDGNEYSGGKIYDPANGKTYNCTMKVEGKVLKVRGSLDKRGLIGRTMDWFRQ